MISLTANDTGNVALALAKACGSIERQSEEMERLNTIIAEQAGQIKDLEQRLELAQAERQQEGT